MSFRASPFSFLVEEAMGKGNSGSGRAGGWVWGGGYFPSLPPPPPPSFPFLPSRSALCFLGFGAGSCAEDDDEVRGGDVGTGGRGNSE